MATVKVNQILNGWCGPNVSFYYAIYLDRLTDLSSKLCNFSKELYFDADVYI